MNYELQHMGTSLGTGSFAPVPVDDTEFEWGLDYLKAHPYDEFMHTYLLNLGMTFGPNLVRHLVGASAEEGPHLLALMVELDLLNERLKGVTNGIDATRVQELAAFTPLIFIRWSLEKRDDRHAYWLRIFADAVLRHQERVPLDEVAQPLPFDESRIASWKSGVVPIAQMVKTGGSDCHRSTSIGRTTAEDTWRRAVESLTKIGIIMNRETRNPASLTPFALQVEWQMKTAVAMGRHDWTLTGQMKSYGKGTHMDEAKASCFMEVAERVSAFADFGSEGPLHYRDDHRLMVGHHSELTQTHPLLDPNDLLLETPYNDEILHWISGECMTDEGPQGIHVPAQLAFLFCNLDEINLTSGLPSTGLASGNTMEEAKRSALLEAIERDAERLVPYSKDKCFSLEPETPPLAQLLNDLQDLRPAIQFMDMTSEFGIPCFKVFIEGPGGEILKGCAADLDATRALRSALTELPYHPSWFQSPIAAPNLPVLKEGSLPCYSTGNAAKDLALLEKLLLANKYSPVYVNLTREDLGIPVVKALIPGLELLPEFQPYSPLSLRQFAHYFYT